MLIAITYSSLGTPIYALLKKENFLDKVVEKLLLCNLLEEYSICSIQHTVKQVSDIFKGMWIFLVLKVTGVWDEIF